jgi:O-acetyl-ADP-ribose deacetylase (regulator of RNase III)
MKPRVFVGSSKEQLALAYAIQKCFNHDADVTVWTQGVFEVSKTALESLLAALDRMDYGVFVFAPDDLVTIRGMKMKAARDNVVFELGLFMGRLGRGHGFVIAPEGHDLRVPTDLLATTPALYDPNRAKTEPEPALATACHAIREVILRPSAGTVTRIDGGFRLLLSPQHSIDLVTGAIQDACPDKNYGAVVLPANTTFDDECINDLNSALGAYFQTHLKAHIPGVLGLIHDALDRTHTTIGTGPAAYPPGTAVYLDRPLKTPYGVIIAAVTEKIPGAGIQADTLSLVASLKGIMRLASDKRIAELWMPVLGTGHGGLDFSVALAMIVVQLSNGILREGYHCIHRAVVMVYDPEGRRGEQIERLAKAFPAMVRT